MFDLLESRVPYLTTVFSITQLSSVKQGQAANQTGEYRAWGEFPRV